jgi:methylenetetrahydrofolate reductase (NADPH)
MLANTKCLYTDMTWGAGGSTADLSLDLALHAHKTGHVSNMHLTCTNMEKDGDPIKAVHDALQSAYNGGIRNIVALRGDPPEGEKEWTASEGGFTCALDLVKYIRENFGDDFGISVAGYPEGHPNRISQLTAEEVENMSDSEKGRCCTHDGITYVCKDDDYKKEMDYLKEKIDAGADFIITQMFFDAEVFKTFVNDCRKWGIDCPVVPGLMCINAYPGFKKMTKFCKTRVPKSLEDKMDSMKDDPEAVKAFGVEFGAEICRSLLDSGSKILHFYTLNLEKVVYGITDELGITSGLIEKSNESDAKDMVAVGSAWARVGDTVKFSAGQGVVKEIKSDGAAVVEVDGKDVEVAKGSYEKVF